MKPDDVAFMLEAIEENWAYRFKSTKLGVDFWLHGTNHRAPGGQVGFTVQEFIGLSKMNQAEISAILAAKSQFPGSKVSYNAVEAHKNAVPFESKKETDAPVIQKPKEPINDLKSPKRQIDLF